MIGLLPHGDPHALDAWGRSARARRTRRRAASVALAFVLVGCGSSSGGEQTGSSTSRPPQVTTTTSTSTTTTTTTAPTTTTTAARTAYGTVGEPQLGVDCATLKAAAGIDASDPAFTNGGVAFATVPGEAILVWGYDASAAQTQHTATLHTDGSVTGPFRYDDPAGQPWQDLIDRGFDEGTQAVPFTVGPSGIGCTPGTEYALGSTPGA